MDWTNYAAFIPIISLLSLLLLWAHNKDDPPTLPPIPLSPGLIAPTVFNAAPCLLLCAWHSQLQCHCKEHITAPAHSTPCPTPPFQKIILPVVGATILTFMATRQEQQWKEEGLHSSLRAWPSCDWFSGWGWAEGQAGDHRLLAPHCEVQPQLPCSITSSSYKLAERWDRRMKGPCIVISVFQKTSNFYYACYN